MNSQIDRVLGGDRFVTLKDIKTTGGTTWAAPYSGSFDCTIPEGTVLLAKFDQVKGARGFACFPEKYKELEKQLVPAKDRYEMKYSGYHFVFLNEDIGTNLKLISRASVKERHKYEFKLKIQSWIQDIFILRALYTLALYTFIIITLPLRPIVNFYRKKKLEAQRSAEAQNNEKND